MHRSGRIVALVATVVLLSSGCDWLQWGNGAGHGGAIYESAITPANISGFVSSTMLQLPASSPAVTAHGLVYVERDGRLTALDAKSYGVVWSAVLPSGATAGGAPAIHGPSGTIFVVVAGASNPVLLGFDLDGVRHCNAAMDTCAPVFRANLGNSSGPATPPVVDGNKILANGAGSVYAFDAAGQTGCASSLGTAVCSPLWSAPTGFAASGIGPAVANGIVYDPVNAGGTAIGAFDEQSGAPLWTGSLGPSTATATPSVGSDGTVFVPTGSAVAAFNGNGCGSATCARLYSLVQTTGDAAGAFLGTPAIDGSLVYATNATGRLYAWPNTGCAPSCQPSLATTVDAPAGGATDYRQSPVVANGVLFLLSRQVVGGGGHVVLLALDAANGNPLTTFDLGAGGFGTGLANASVASGVVYAPIAGALVAVHAPPVQPLASLSTSPLTLSPAFSPSTFDYVVRCAAGTNSLTITMSAQAGGTVAMVAPITTSPSPSQVNTVDLTENQAAVIEAADPQGAKANYWIRCLPSDFPPLTATTYPGTGKPTPGWYVIGNNIVPTGGTPYAMILDTNGTPVWYKRGTPTALNVTPLGHDTVAFMPNPTFAGFGADPNGKYDVYSLDSNQVSAIRTVGVPTDLHELYPLPNGDHLLLSYPLKRGVDLTGLQATPTPGPNSTIADCVVQHVDAQGQLVWQWTASDHIDPVTETTLTSPVTINGETVYDVFHCNSIDPSSSGEQLLVSARHLNAVFEIRRSDGKIVWKMGGTPVNKDGAAIIQIQNDPEGGIVQQHDARYMPNGHISLYDNQSFASNLPARGVEYALNLVAKTAQVAFSFATPTGAPSCCMGSLRRYPDGHRLIGWGYVLPSNGAAFTELDAAGNDVFDVRFATGHATYRAVKAPPTRFDINVMRATAGQ